MVWREVKVVKDRARLGLAQVLVYIASINNKFANSGRTTHAYPDTVDSRHKI